MTCDVPESVTGRQQMFIKAFRKKIFLKRIPVSGSIELTKRCNLRCVHCYNGGIDEKGRDDLPGEAWMNIIDQITEAGCIFLLITGGDPLIRPDFPELYLYARKKGLVVTVFTNGTLLNERAMNAFRESPPSLVEISLYGATEKTYETVTGVKGSFRRCMEGIEMLLKADIHIVLKTVILRENLDEFQEIRDFAKSRGLKFRSDPCISPALNGDLSPITHRPDPGKAVIAELSDPAVCCMWRDFLKANSEDTHLKSLYACGAGKTSFHVSFSGVLKPCLMTDYFSYDLREGSFLEGWQKVIPRISEIPVPPGLKCRHCDKILLCGYCPASLELENGTGLRHSDYLCKVGEYRLKYLKRWTYEREAYT